MDNFKTFEKIGEYKKEMKRFVKGLVKSKLFQDEDGDLTIYVEREDNKEKKQKIVYLKAENEGFTVEFGAIVATRVYNKIDPTLFEALAAQLEKTKGFGKLLVK